MSSQETPSANGTGAKPVEEGFEPGSLGVQLLFPTPLVSAQLADAATLNAKLAAAILAREETERGVVASNRGGWHSTEFQSWCGPAGDTVLEAARRLVEKMTIMQNAAGYGPARIGWHIAAWANISRAGDSNQAHAHAGAFWSGVYWVDDGGVAADPAQGGLFELADPRGTLPIMYAPHLRPALEDCLPDGQGQTVTPQAGTLILFPSWLIHSVAPYRGTRPRISVAFNFSIGGGGRLKG